MQSESNAPREFAAIDLGSNSFHMIVARIVNGSIQILSRIKRRVRLAEGLDEQNHLSQEAIDRGVACLGLFAKRLRGFSAENVKVVGTYTLRRAANNADFVAQAAKVFPFPINIISGQEEARLIYAGVSHTQSHKGRKLVVDIGGGSTEMTIGDDFVPLRAESRHMGCVSFAKRFFPNGELTSAHFEAAYNSAMEKIKDLEEEYRRLGWKHVLGSSGTIKTVSNVLLASGYKNGLITETRLQILIEQCLVFKNLNDIQHKGLLVERSDVFVPGLAILLALFRTFKIKTMRYSDGALREGIMYGWADDFQVDNIRRRTAQGLSKQYAVDQAQAKRIKTTALRLFDQVTCWRNRNQINELRSLLSWASQFYEVGMSINYKNMHRHSAYIMTHSDLPGFDIEQRHLLVILMRNHLKHFQKNDLHSLNRFQQSDVLVLVRLFRLAVLLNRLRQASVMPQQLLLNIEKRRWVLTFESGFLKQNPLIFDELIEECELLKAFNLQLVLDD